MTFEEFYTDNYRSVCKYAYRYLRSKQQVEEVAQDVLFLAFTKSIHREHEKPVAWLIATTRVIVKRIWSQKTVESLEWDIPFYPDEELWELLPQGLSEDELILAEMLIMDAMTYAEIATALGITFSACDSRVRRLREKIKSLLAEHQKDSVR